MKYSIADNKKKELEIIKLKLDICMQLNQMQSDTQIDKEIHFLRELFINNHLSQFKTDEQRQQNIMNFVNHLKKVGEANKKLDIAIN